MAHDAHKEDHGGGKAAQGAAAGCGFILAAFLAVAVASVGLKVFSDNLADPKMFITAWGVASSGATFACLGVLLLFACFFLVLAVKSRSIIYMMGFTVLIAIVIIPVILLVALILAVWIDVGEGMERARHNRLSLAPAPVELVLDGRV